MWLPVILTHNTGNLFEAFNLQVVSATGWAAQRMEEMIYHSELRTVFSAGNGEVELYEVTIPNAWNNQKVGQIDHQPDLPGGIGDTRRASFSADV